MEQLTGNVLNIHNEYRNYQEYKTAVDTELRRSAEGFVRIGYLLKVARDTDILRESGYQSVNEFAEAEYGLDKSQVSRFIRINDEFSEEGYSDRLQDRYQRFGYAKLALMLMLPAAVNEELTADYTKAEIQTIKAEIDGERQRTDIEVMLEEKDGRQQEYGISGKVLYQLGHNDPKMYVRLHRTVRDGAYTAHEAQRRVADILAPAGEAVISVRIAGEGKKLLSIRGTETDPVVVDVRSAEKTSCTWSEFMSELSRMCTGDNPEESWKILYGENFPAKEEPVAPVQPEQDRQAPKKTQRVTVSEPETPINTGEDRSLTEKGTEKEETAATEGQEEGSGNVSETGQERLTGHAGQDNTGDGTAEMDAAHDPAEADGDPAYHRPSGDNADVAEPGDPPYGAGTGSKGEPAEDAADTGKDQPAAGQLSIQDYPEYLPDSYKPEPAQHTPQYMVKGYLDALRDNLDKIYALTDSGEYCRAEEYLEAVRGCIHKVRDVRRD